MKKTEASHLIYIQKFKRFPLSNSKLSIFTALMTSNDIKAFLAKAIASEIPKLKSLDLIASCYLNKISFRDEIAIVDLLAPLLDYSLQEDLCSIIKLSRFSNSITLAAANAIFILNYAGYEFRNLDFSRINISGANLSQSLFFNVNFDGSNLSGINISQSKLYNCNFNNCDFTNSCLSNFTLFEKDSNSITKVKFSKNGELLLSCSRNDIKLWDFKKKSLIAAYKTVCTDAQFSPCGNFIALIGVSTKLCIIDIKSEKLYEIGTNGNVSSVSFSLCGKYIAIREWNSVQLNDTETFTKIKSWKIYDPSNGLIFTKCGNFILVGSRSTSIKQLSIINETINNIYTLPNGEIKGEIFFSQNYKYLCWHDRGFSVLDFVKKELIFKLTWTSMGQKILASMLPSIFPNLLVSWLPSEDKICFLDLGDIHLYDIAKQMIVTQIRGNYKNIQSICFSQYEKYAVIGCNDGWIKLWDFESQKFQKEIEILDEYIISATFSENYLYRVTNYGNIDRYDITNRRAEKLFKSKITKKGEVMDVSFSDCRVLCAIGLSDNTIVILELETKNLFGALKDSCKGYFSSINFSSSGRLLFSCYASTSTIIIWNIEQKSIILRLSSCVNFLSIAPDEKYFASPDTFDITIWMHDQNYKKISILKNSSLVRSLAFSECSKFLYAGHDDGNIVLWDYLKAEQIKEFRGKFSSAFILTCKKGLVARVTKKITLWDVEKGEKLKEINASLDTLYNTKKAFAVTASGEWVVLGGIHKTLKIWKLS